MRIARVFGRLVPGLAIVAVIAVARPTPAHACPCFSFPGPGRFYLGADGTLPRDALGIPWSGPNTLRPVDYPTPPVTDRVELLRHVDGREVPEAFTVAQSGRIDLIVPAGGVNSGDTFTVTVREYGDDDPWWRSRNRPPRRKKAARPEPPPAFLYQITATVTVTADAAPLRGATIELSRRRKRVIKHGEFAPPSCTGERESDTIDLTTILPPALEPYRDYLLYETRIDGKPRRDQQYRCQFFPPGRSWMVEPGSDLLFSECGKEVDGGLESLDVSNYPPVPRAGLSPQGYGVAVTISTPDGAHTFTTPTLRFEIGCATSPPPEAELPAMPASSAPPSVLPPLAAPSGPPPTSPPPTSPPRGCTLAAPAWTWLLAPLLLLRRRRRSP